ncbi:MAG: hydrolase 1, exosortase A system-associated [Burkholderiales bacterium]
MTNPAQQLNTTSPLAYREEAVVFGQGRWVGVLCLPEGIPKSVVIVVVGGPQYRVGSHRQFVQLSRALASQGHASLRFDCTGMGDSPGELRNFLNIEEDIGAAINFVRAQLPAVQTLALWGLCDGASAALLYVHARGDAGIHGLCLLNPWVRSEVSQAQTQIKHYYVQRLQDPAFWRKLFTGKVAASAALDLGRTLRTLWRAKPAEKGGVADAPTGTPAPFQSRMATAWQKYSGAILLILSEDDYTAKEFLGATQNDAQWKGKLRQRNVRRHDVVRADHTFSGAATRLEIEQVTARWLNELSDNQASVATNAATTRTTR